MEIVSSGVTLVEGEGKITWVKRVGKKNVMRKTMIELFILVLNLSLHTL